MRRALVAIACGTALAAAACSSTTNTTTGASGASATTSATSATSVTSGATGTTRLVGVSGSGTGTTAGTTVATPAVPTPGDAVTIMAYEFRPGILTAPVGTTVTWLNSETDPPVDHQVRSLPTVEKVLDSPKLAPGATYQKTFDAPGTYAYYCLIHNFMKGTVEVS